MPRPPARLPILEFRGAFARQQAANRAMGNDSAATHAGDSLGFEFGNEGVGVTRHLAIRPARMVHPADAMPCDCSADFFFQFQRNAVYDDDDIELIFRLTCGDRSGILGGAAELEVNSNFPELRMGLDKFTIAAARQSVQASAVVPEAYVARIALKFWSGNANLSSDDCIWFEMLYRLNAGAAVSAMKTAFYPLPNVLGGRDVR